MRYTTYRNCSEAEFRSLRKSLGDLSKGILSFFGTRLKQDSSAKDLDYLVLNYSISDNQPYLSNLAIMFIDLPGEALFNISILKALDIDLIRYYKKEQIAERVPLSALEINYEVYVSNAVAKYDLWDKSALLNGEQRVIDGG